MIPAALQGAFNWCPLRLVSFEIGPSSRIQTCERLCSCKCLDRSDFSGVSAPLVCEVTFQWLLPTAEDFPDLKTKCFHDLKTKCFHDLKQNF